MLVWAAATSIHRAGMDGSDVQVLTNVEQNSVWDLAIDPKTLLVYWTDVQSKEIFRCDLEGRNRSSLSFSPRLGMPIAVTVLNNTIYWLEYLLRIERDKRRTSLFQATGEKEQLVLADDELTDLEIVPLSINDLSTNPCQYSPCSHICVRSSRKSHTCLCDDDFAFHQDGYNCTGEIVWLVLNESFLASGLLQSGLIFIRLIFLAQRYLVVSTEGGIWRVPFLASSAPKLLGLEASTPSYVQCDGRRRRIYWALKGYLNASIYESDMTTLEDGLPSRLVLSWHNLKMHYPYEGMRKRRFSSIPSMKCITVWH